MTGHKNTGPFGLPSPQQLMSGLRAKGTGGDASRTAATIGDHTVVGKGVYYPNQHTVALGYQGLAPGERISDMYVSVRAAYPMVVRITAKMVQGNKVMNVPLYSKLEVEKGKTIEFRPNTVGDPAGKVVEDLRGFRGKGVVVGLVIEQMSPMTKVIYSPRKAVDHSALNPAGGFSHRKQ
jgi:hypothetical protein